MPQNGKVNSPASPPFSTPDGKPAAASGGSDGAHDFIKDPNSSGVRAGGRDFVKESRKQSEADPRGPGNPNTQEIPTGGKNLKADPGPVSKTVSGPAGGGVKGVPQTPFKGLR